MTNQSVLKVFREIAARKGLQYNAENEALWGELDGYPVIFYVPNSNYPKNVDMVLGATRNGAGLSKEESAQIKRNVKNVLNVSGTNSSLTVQFRCSNVEKSMAVVEQVMQAVRQYGLTRACQLCGRDVPATASNMGGAYLSLCDECFEKTRAEMELKQGVQQSEKESVVAGTVGALLGALLGVISIVVIARLGYISALSGIIMAVCTLYGYEKLGRKLTKKGVVICVVIMLVMTYVGDRLDWAFVLMQEWGEIGLFEAYQGVPILLSMGVIEAGSYWMNLGLLYLFVALGAVPMTISRLKAVKNRNKLSRFDGTPVQVQQVTQEAQVQAHQVAAMQAEEPVVGEGIAD